jgi:hypothetical protein
MEGGAMAGTSLGCGVCAGARGGVYDTKDGERRSRHTAAPRSRAAGSS